MSYYCKKCPRIIEEDDSNLCPECASSRNKTEDKITSSRFRWEKHSLDQWVLSDEHGFEASIGRLETPNVQFVNIAPDVEVVLMVADKIRELGWDKGEFGPDWVKIPEDKKICEHDWLWCGGTPYDSGEYSCRKCGARKSVDGRILDVESNS